jgi:hypothetical protein
VCVVATASSIDAIHQSLRSVEILFVCCLLVVFVQFVKLHICGLKVGIPGLSRDDRLMVIRNLIGRFSISVGEEVELIWTNILHTLNAFIHKLYRSAFRSYRN